MEEGEIPIPNGCLKNDRKEIQMNPATFLQNCDRIITGYGFKRSVPIPLGSLRLIATGADIGVDAAESGIAMLDTGGLGMVLWADDDTTDIAQINFVVPQDYDETNDKLRLRVLCSADDNATDTFYIDAKVYRKRAAAALSADLDPTISPTAVPATIATAAWREVNIDDEGMQGGDCLTIILAASAHTTSGLLIYGIEMVYSATLVYFDEDDRPISG